jgi:hypothetical protein
MYGHQKLGPKPDMVLCNLTSPLAIIQTESFHGFIDFCPLYTVEFITLYNGGKVLLFLLFFDLWIEMFFSIGNSAKLSPTFCQNIIKLFPFPSQKLADEWDKNGQRASFRVEGWFLRNTSEILVLTRRAVNYLWDNILGRYNVLNIHL